MVFPVPNIFEIGCVTFCYCLLPQVGPSQAGQAKTGCPDEILLPSYYAKRVNTAIIIILTFSNFCLSLRVPFHFLDKFHSKWIYLFDKALNFCYYEIAADFPQL